MELKKIVEVAIKWQGSESRMDLARVGSINEFHFADSKGTCFLRSDQPAAEQREGNIYDNGGYIYEPLDQDTHSDFYQRNRELIAAATKKANIEEMRKRLEKDGFINNTRIGITSLDPPVRTNIDYTDHHKYDLR